MTMRIGTGFDVHALVAGRPLVMGGVTIPHPRGLAGHSDADVLLHAITDALLGALALGDLGAHFPDTDRAGRARTAARCCATSRRWSRRAATRSATSTRRSIAQAPKLAPHVAAMRAQHRGRPGLRRRARVGQGDDDRAPGLRRPRGGHRGRGGRAAACARDDARRRASPGDASTGVARRAVLGQRQRHARDRAAAVARQQVEAAAVQPRDAIDDREPESRAGRAVGARPRFGRARERLLQALDVVGRDAGAAIGDVEHRHAARARVVVTSTGGAP